MKRLILALLLIASICRGQEISPGLTFVDGQRLTAAQLGLLVSQGKILPAFFLDKSAQTNISPTDILLIYSPASGTFHQVTGQAGLFNNTAIIGNQPVYSSVNNSNYYFLGYDQTNNLLFQVSLANFVATMPLSDIPPYSPAQPSFFNQTNPVNFFVFDTNDQPASITASNAAASFAPILGNLFSLPYTYKQIFLPWTVYGTNSSTNAWGYYTNFPITLYQFTNNAQTNIPTLSSTDQIPVNSGSQRTNTTATLAALAQYFLLNGGQFVSTNAIIPSNGSQVIIPHLLGVTPKFVRAVLVCITNDVATTYKTNQEYDINQVCQQVGNFVHEFTVYDDATNVYVTRASTGSVNLATPAGAAYVAVTAVPNFRIKIYASP